MKRKKGEVNTIGAPDLPPKMEICSKQLSSFKKIAGSGASETETIPRLEDIGKKQLPPLLSEF